MLKISSEEVSAVSARGAIAIRTLTQKVASLEVEKAGLLEKVAEHEREKEINAIASDMEEKGLNADLTLDEKIAHIRTSEDLNRVREAVKMASARCAERSMSEGECNESFRPLTASKYRGAITPATSPISPNSRIPGTRLQSQW